MTTKRMVGAAGMVVLATAIALASCATPIGAGENSPQPVGGSAEAVAARPTIVAPTPSTQATEPPGSTQTPTAVSSIIPNTAEPTVAISTGNLIKLAPLHVLEVHSDDVTDVAFSPDGSLLASSSKDGTIRLWDVKDGSLIRTFVGHAHTVLSIAFSPDGEWLVSGSDDRTARVWRVSDGTILHTIRNFTEGRVLQVSFSPDGSLFAMADHLCYVQLRRSGSGILYRILTQPGCAARVNGSVAAWGMDFTNDGGIIITAEGQPSRGGSIHLWQVEEPTVPYLLSGYKMMVRDLEFSPDESTLIVALLGSSTFVMLDAKDGRWLQEFEGHRLLVNSVTFSPDGTLVASGSRDRTTRLWQVGSGELLQTLEGHSDSVNSVAISPDGSLIASASDDDTLIIWGIPSP